MIVLDTATWIWRASDPKRLTTSARRAIDEAERVLSRSSKMGERLTGYLGTHTAAQPQNPSSAAPA